MIMTYQKRTDKNEIDFITKVKLEEIIQQR